MLHTTPHTETMAGLQAHYLTMARYNRWATAKLWTFLRANVTDAAYKLDVGLPMAGSIHSTMNHILLAERVWHGRMTDNIFPIATLTDEIVSDSDGLEQAMLASADELIHLVQSLPHERLASEYQYSNSRGEPNTQVYGNTLSHVFNHGTHHRGQISGAMGSLLPGATGKEKLENIGLDLLYFLNPAA